jgi:hypothetical protein
METIYDLLIVSGIISTTSVIYGTLKKIYKNKLDPFEKYKNKLIESKEGGNLERKIRKD